MVQAVLMGDTRQANVEEIRSQQQPSPETDATSMEAVHSSVKGFWVLLSVVKWNIYRMALPRRRVVKAKSDMLEGRPLLKFLAQQRDQAASHAQCLQRVPGLNPQQ
jgi:hypothetical protein